MGPQHGINANLLRTWITRYRRQRALVAGQAAGGAVVGEPAFVPVVAAGVAARRCAVRLGAQLPNGVKLELDAVDSGELTMLLRLLCELPCSGSKRG
jgi:transposase